MMETPPIAACPLDGSVQEQFEYWMSDEGKSPKAVEKKNGEYILLQARTAWLVWEAAAKADREAMCTKIKAADDKASDNDYMLDSDDCISVIRGTWEPNWSVEAEFARVPLG